MKQVFVRLNERTKNSLDRIARRMSVPTGTLIRIILSGWVEEREERK